MVLKGIFHLIAMKKGPHWKLTEKEIVELRPSAARVCYRWAPFLQEWGAEVFLFLGLLAVVGDRVEMDKKLAGSAPEGGEPGAKKTTPPNTGPGGRPLSVHS